MRNYLILMLLAVVVGGCAKKCAITPVPKTCTISETTNQLESSAVIIVGEKADQVDQYAAQRLQTLISKRFGMTVAITDQKRDSKQIIVMGRPETNSYLAKVCNRNKLTLNAETPGFDGYIVETVKDNGKDVVIIGGSNARGVTYGALVFFDLLKKDDDRVVFPSVSIHDRPSIAWRGRICGKNDDDTVLDSFVRARINFTDTHQMVGHKHKWDVNEVKTKKVLADAHKRGIFMYGVVTCAVEPNEFDKVVTSFEKLINLGVDGIWLSFDDAGEGVGTDVLVARVLELAHKHNLSGHQIVMTPPTGSYQYIETQWNKTMAAKPGFNEITSFFTEVPSGEFLATAKKIGLTKVLPAWWYNWPRPSAGLLSGAYGINLYDGTPYFEIPSFQIGWHMPTSKELADADRFIDMAVICASGPEEYVLPVFGIWAWDPASYDWNKARTAIYSDVFGPSQTQTARKFDDDFAQLKSLFTRVKYKAMSPETWPPRLIDPNNKALAKKLAGQMQCQLEELKANAPAQSLLAVERLNKVYFEPMTDTVEYGKKLSSLEYPEYWLPDFSAQMQVLAQSNPQEATARINAVKDKVNVQLQQISTELAKVKDVNEYVNYWNAQLSGVEYWQTLAAMQGTRTKKEAKLRKQMAEIFPSAIKGNYDDLLAAQNTPPKKGKVLAIVSPAEWVTGKMNWKGEGWGIGLYKSDKYQAAAIVRSGDSVCENGESAELAAHCIVPKYKGRLKVQVFVAQYQQGQTPADRQARFNVLSPGRSWAWMQDAGNSTKGNEWVTIEALSSYEPAVKPGESLNITMMVTTIRDTKFESIVLFGPMRLIEE